MDVQVIGNRIKQARALRNYTLDDIANDIGVAKSTVQRYENGLINKPKIPVLQAIAESLKVNPAWLCGKDVSMIIDDSLKSIIDNCLKESGLSLKEVAEKAQVSFSWLKNIDSFIPGIDEYVIDGSEGHALDWDATIGGCKSYDAITKVAEVLGVLPGTLRVALARQEIPAYDGPAITAKEAFTQAQEDFNEPLKEDTDHYYLNDETRQIAQEVFENPQLRSLFHVARDISPERLKSQIDYLKFLKSQEKGNDEEGC